VATSTISVGVVRCDVAGTQVLVGVDCVHQEIPDGVDQQGRPKFKSIQLTSWSAKIIEEIVHHTAPDQTTRRYVISGYSLRPGVQLPDVTIDVDKYGDGHWVREAWGADTTLPPGPPRGLVLAAIEIASGTRARRTTYGYTGWVEQEDVTAPIFVHAEGAIGLQGVETDLDKPLCRIQLVDPRIISSEAACAAMQMSLRLLDCGSQPVMIPLLGALGAAPLIGLALETAGMLIWFWGPTGKGKSTRAALVQAHYGSSFDLRTLPTTWSSTMASIEDLLHRAGGLVTVVDNATPRHDENQRRTIEHILQAIGDGASRGRMTRTMQRRADVPPRGFMISTGEQRPDGGSTSARCYCIEVDEPNWSAITKLQRGRDQLPIATSTYLAWLRSRFTELQQVVSMRVTALRDGYTVTFGVENHPRYAEQVALLHTGLELYTQCAVEVGALNRTKQADLLVQAMTVWREGGQQAAAEHQEDDPAEVWMEAIRTLLAQNRVRLANRVGAATLLDIGELIGYRDDEGVYLLPSAALEAVRRHLGFRWPWSDRDTASYLARAGWVTREPPKGAPRRYLGGEQQRCWVCPQKIWETGRRPSLTLVP
jgi:hypothetical protein